MNREHYYTAYSAGRADLEQTGTIDNTVHHMCLFHERMAMVKVFDNRRKGRDELAERANWHRLFEMSAYRIFLKGYYWRVGLLDRLDARKM